MDSFSIEDLQQLLRSFATKRNWEVFHTPKNLAMALAGEAGELLAIFQWMTPEESVSIMADPNRAAHIQDELADVFSYLLQLADVLDVDLSRAVAQKIQQNEVRYPIAKSSGNAKKYTELE